MPAQDIIVIGGSAGALEALTTVLTDLPRDFGGTILTVLHTSPQSGGALPQILERDVSLPVRFPEDGEAFQRGRIYVAPPDHHLTIARGVLHVDRGPRENGFRPAVDPLFRSAAKEFAGRVVGVVFSGAMDDGTFGLIAVKEAGGTAIVQHPYEALVPGMPLSAIQNVEVDHIIPAREIASLLIRATEVGLHSRGETPRAKSPKRADPTRRDVNLATVPPDLLGDAPSKFVCPDCGGALWEVEEGGLARYRCFTGHGYTPDTLLAAQNGKLEHALWSAVRVLMERAALHRQLAHRTANRGMKTSADRYSDRAEQEDKHANIIREMLAKAPLLVESPPPEMDRVV
jgi:two-component system chemotaxis response regulator CheB